MSRLEIDLARMREVFGDRLDFERSASGAHLIRVKDYELVAGWSQPRVTILFVAPPAFPAAQPDCFWVEPGGLRLSDGVTTPQASNDSNPMPEFGPHGTWFSWHLQQWNPNQHSVLSYFRVIEKRLDPPR